MFCVFGALLYFLWSGTSGFALNASLLQLYMADLMFSIRSNAGVSFIVRD